VKSGYAARSPLQKFHMSFISILHTPVILFMQSTSRRDYMVYVKGYWIVYVVSLIILVSIFAVLWDCSESDCGGYEANLVMCLENDDAETL